MLASWECTRVEHEGSGEVLPMSLEAQAAHARVERQLFGEDASEPTPTLGRFQVVRQIGRGAMGVVYEGLDPDLDRRVALKVLRADADAQGSMHARSRMIREAKALARLRHPHVTTIYEVGTTGRGVPFIAMELVEGRTLKGWLRSRPRSCGEIVDVFLQAGRGLAAAHEAGLVHRDFKPDNLIIDHEGQARVVDFGLARSAGLGELMPTLDESEDGEPVDLHLTCTGAILGTPAYMAPEQFLGGPAHTASDQFSFCVSLFEALYGRRPYPGNDLPSLQRSLIGGEVVGPRRGVPRRLYRVLRRGLATDPSARFSSMDDLLDALAAARPRSRSRRPALLVAGLALAAAAGAWTSVGPTAGSAVDSVAPAEPSMGALANIDNAASAPEPSPEAPVVSVVARAEGASWGH
ncbi:MAG: serine/threonine-protein kinase [Myxococcota bacterium]